MSPSARSLILLKWEDEATPTYTHWIRDPTQFFQLKTVRITLAAVHHPPPIHCVDVKVAEMCTTYLHITFFTLALLVYVLSLCISSYLSAINDILCFLLTVLGWKSAVKSQKEKCVHM